MKLENVSSITKSPGIQPGKFPKIELIKAIQVDEANLNCFASAYSRVCDQEACLWRADCFDYAKIGQSS